MLKNAERYQRSTGLSIPFLTNSEKWRVNGGKSKVSKINFPINRLIFTIP